ncbi:MAG: FecR family protein [Moraxellaceae bacterium]|nr:MAG: FecR family protein [Moraxellaceae bacterium]
MNSRICELDEQALEWLVKLNSGQVSAAQEQAFFEWLHTSTAHQAAYLRAENLWQQGDIVEKLTSTEASAETQKLDAQPRTSYRPNRQLVFGNWAIASCALLVIATIGFITLSPSPTHYHLVSAIGEQRQITLEDGTQLLLNTNSELDVEYSGKHRTATLQRGEVYFGVHPDAQRPFNVITRFGMVRVLGTHFSVHQRSDDAVITVLEGRVALGKKPTSDQHFSPVVELHANERLSLQQAQHGGLPNAINAKSALAWRDKQLVYQKQKLALVIEELNRYFAVKITLSDTATGERDITAVIQLGELEATLNALCQPLNLKAQFTADRREVLLAPRN